MIREGWQHCKVLTVLRLFCLSKSQFTRGNGKMRSLEPGPTANSFTFLVNKNALVWKGEE